MKEKREISQECFRERVCRCLDIPPDSIPGEQMIELRGRGYIKIHGGGRLLEYTPERITVKRKKDRVSVDGKRLRCVSYHPEAIIIEGRISSVCFEEGEK